MQKIAPVTHMDGSYWPLVVETRFYAFVLVVFLLRQIHRAERFLTGSLCESSGMEHLSEGLIVDCVAVMIAAAYVINVRVEHRLNR
jgi:hypothetical protein